MVKRGELITLDIVDIAFGGQGIAKMKNETGDYILFVQNAYPGQKVLARVQKKRKKHAECSLIKILSRSSVEIISDFQEISGAPYIFVPPEIQEEQKKRTTLEVYRRIAGLKNVETIFDEFISSPQKYFYRNKMEYSFSSIEFDLISEKDLDDAFALGFKHRGTWWKVENLNRPSGLFDEEWETLLKEIRAFLEKTGLPAWHPPKKEGFFRHIVVRKSFFEDKLLVNLITSSQEIQRFEVGEMGRFLKEKLGARIAGFLHTINDNVADRAKIENGNTTLVFGRDFLVERLNGLEFEMKMESFFQTNPKCAELLYEKAVSYVFDGNRNLQGKVVMDLFCGTGTIGQIIAKKTENIQVIGVDIVEEAILDARKNAARNNISKIDFFAADVGKFLKEQPQYVNKIDTIVLDPPRAGIAPKSLKKVIELEASRIVYISCNPSTQARDIKLLEENGYATKKITLIDQFPHTGHIEAIALFEK